MIIESKSRLVARGICIRKHKILLARSLNSESYFLPGGGIEDFEGASSCLVREIKEEIAVTATIVSFVGVVENYWEAVDSITYERNFVFTFEFKKNESVCSNERDLKFEWIDVTDLEKIDLKPDIMKEAIKQTFFGKNNTFWYSNYIK